MRRGGETMNQRKAGAVLSYVYLGITFVIGIIYTPILFDFLGEREYGVYSVASSAIAFLAILDLGFSQTMIRYVARCRALGDREGEERLHGMFLLLYTGIAVIALVVGLFIYCHLELFFQRGFTPDEVTNLSQVFLILLINLVVSFPLGIFNSVISAGEGFVFLKTVNIISTVLTHAGILLALVMGYRTVAMALITTVVSVGLKLVTMFYGRRKYQIRFRFGGFDRALFREIFLFSFFIFLNIVIDQLYANTDKMILGAFCSSAAVATYTVGVQFYSYFEQFSTSISGVFLPKITALLTADGGMREVSALFIRIGRIQFILLAFLMSGFIIMGKQFIALWVGESQQMSYYIALVILIPALIPLSQNIGISVLRAMNRHRFRSVIYLFIALANVALSIPLALAFGGIGAASATAFATCTGQILVMNWFYGKKIGLDIRGYWREILPIFFKSAAIGALAWALIYFIPVTGWAGLILKGLIFCVVFGALAWLSILNGYEKSIVTGALARLRRRNT